MAEKQASVSGERDLYPEEVRVVPLRDGVCVELICRSFLPEPKYVVHVTGKSLEELASALKKIGKI